MKVFQRKDLYAACVTLLSASLYLGGIARAQSAAPQARIVEAVQNEKLVTLRGNVHPMARPANDRGSLPDQQPVTRMHVLLQRSAEQEDALQLLLADQQDPNSSKFHAWLTPQEFGQQFGPAESDLRAVKAWLNSQGFTSLRVNNGRTLIEFNGTSSQIRNAFHTEMHRLSVNNEEHFANMQEPKIPAALAPVVGGIAGLHDFRPKPLLHRLGKFRRDASTGQITPLFTLTDVNGTFYGVGPADFAKIYNVPSTFDGTGQSIAVVGQSNINLQDVRDFRSIFGLPTNDPQIILNGADPGLVSGDEGESDLDVEWAGAVAPKAQIILVSTQVSAKGYIPETAWNDSCANAATAGNLTVCANATATSTTSPLNIVAGSGGPSSIYKKTQAPWQTGFGDTTARDLPDVSLFSSDGQNKSFYIVCESDADITGDTGCNLTTFTTTSPFHDFQAVGGTSAAAPTFAGIIALVNQKTGQRQGNANITLYSLAKSETFSSCNSSGGTSGSSSNTTCVFNDITKGNISVPCTGASTNCSKTSSGGFGVLVSNGNPAFAAGTGYDLAAGLGSVNVANLISKWATPSLISTSTTLSPSAISGTVGTAVTLSGTVTKSSGSATPTGVVVFENAATNIPAGNVPALNILAAANSADPATLSSSATYSVNTAFLPAATYSLKAHYGGDSTFAASDSAPIAVNLSKQASTVLVSFATFSGNNAGLSRGAQKVQYGTAYILRVDGENASGTPCQDSSGGLV